MNRFALSLFGWLFVVLGFATVGLAHPFHVCVAQMTWNQESRLWEVSLRLHPQDLERAMKAWKLSLLSETERKDGPATNVWKGCSIEDPEFEKVVVDFLDVQFFLRMAPIEFDRKGVSQLIQASPRTEENFSKLKWVGKETEKGWLWIHVEMRPPRQQSAQTRIWLCHQVLIDLIDKQENSVAILDQSKRKYSLQFKKDSLLHPLQENNSTR